MYTDANISNYIYTLSQIHFQSILILAAFWQFTAFLDDIRESSKTKKLKFYEEILNKTQF